MEIHESVTTNRICRPIEDGEYLGVCLTCGEETQHEVEPDAEKYECEFCHAKNVYGAEQILLMTVP